MRDMKGIICQSSFRSSFFVDFASNLVSDVSPEAMSSTAATSASAESFFSAMTGI